MNAPLAKKVAFEPGKKIFVFTRLDLPPAKAMQRYLSQTSSLVPLIVTSKYTPQISLPGAAKQETIHIEMFPNDYPSRARRSYLIGRF